MTDKVEPQLAEAARTAVALMQCAVSRDADGVDMLLSGMSRLELQWACGWLAKVAADALNDDGGLSGRLATFDL